MYQSQQKKNTTKRGKLYSKSTIKTTERHQERHFGIFIDNSEQFDIVLPLFFLTLKIFHISFFQRHR